MNSVEAMAMAGEEGTDMHENSISLSTHTVMMGVNLSVIGHWKHQVIVLAGIC